MKNKALNFLFLSILFVSSMICVGCHHDSFTDKDIQVDPKNGFVAAHVFENGAWTFPKVDDGIDKELHLAGTFPNSSDFYKLTLFVDFYDVIETETLPLVVTTTSPDGNSSQSANVLIEFNDEETVTDLGDENGRCLKRAHKVIYPSKLFAEEGAYQFTVYSKYPKMSLNGVKSLTITAQKVEK